MEQMCSLGLTLRLVPWGTQGSSQHRTAGGCSVVVARPAQSVAERQEFDSVTHGRCVPMSLLCKWLRGLFALWKSGRSMKLRLHGMALRDTFNWSGLAWGPDLQVLKKSKKGKGLAASGELQTETLPFQWLYVWQVQSNSAALFLGAGKR
jgi:hypothetical protein